MAGSFSNYAENKILDHIVGKTSFTMPSIWIGLWAATLSDTSTGATAGEPSGNNYSRKSTAAADWESAASGATQNANAITFATASGSWGTITDFALVDNATTGAGNIIAYGTLTTSKSISSGDTASFAAGDIDITLD